MATRKEHIINKIKDYTKDLGNSYAQTKQWKAGYFCALRDRNLISLNLWHDLVEELMTNPQVFEHEPTQKTEQKAS